MRWLCAFLLVCFVSPVAAQDIDAAQTARDRSYLTKLIEDNLSSAGREIRLEGFAGALSSKARFDTLTIADDKGVWLTIKGATMAWDRMALLRGRIAVKELTAEEIDLPRLPETAPSEAAPEAKPFALPDLPVAVEIGSIKAEKLVLGGPVLGQAAEFSMAGSGRLSGGDGEADLTATRTDGQRGRVALRASYVRDSRQTVLDLLLSEGQGGILAGLLGLPDRPSLTLSMSGLGPIDDFKADVLLGTAGASRLTGTVALFSAKDTGQSGFKLDLGGDVSPLFAAEYRAFFGNDVKLAVAGERSLTGMLRLTDMTLRSQALTVTGGLDLRPDGLPEHIALDAKLGLGQDQSVVLPISGPKTRVGSGALRLTYDRATGEAWRLSGFLNGFDRDGRRIERVGLTGSGRIGPQTVGGSLGISAQGFAPNDALVKALGSSLSAAMQFYWQKGMPLTVSSVRLNSQDAQVQGRFHLTEALKVSGEVTAEHRRLAALSDLVGQSVAGRLTASAEGNYDLGSGAFDLSARSSAQDLALAQPLLAGMLAGSASFDASVRRDETGLTVRNLAAITAGATLRASGHVASDQSTLLAKIEAPNLSRLGRGHAGAVTLEASLAGARDQRQITVTGKGQNLSLPQANVSRILSGQSLFSLAVAQRNGRFHLRDLSFSNPQAKITATPRKGQDRSFDLSARLANVALIVPGFPGPLTIGGSLTDQGNRYALDLRGNGPGGTEAAVKGFVAADFATADLTLSGRAETALANAFIAPQSIRGPLTFDLALKGPPALSSLSGQVAGRGLRLAIPALGQALKDLDVSAKLAGGTAQINGQGSFEGGGTAEIAGPIKLTSPFPAQLALRLDRARLRDPELYDTRVSGKLAVSGGLTGAMRVAGDLRLDDTELRIPSGSIGAAGIPKLTHLHAPAAVQQTRQRAGLVETTRAQPEPSRTIALDVTISAPQQIFVRGRGLDAELGGDLRITGTTANITPIGQFSLLRGRLDVLGKRFTLTEGQVVLQGALVPWVLFKATTSQKDLDITMTLQGPATEPKLTVTSSPDLPEEEVLARLLFDKGLSTISPLQAAQLASAVATLAGKGGDGIVSNLRKGFGLDDLDVGTDDSGNATVKVGKYLAKNVYSDVAVDSVGQAEVTLNLDLSKQVTARISVGSDSTSSAGVFYEKDY